MTRRIVAGAVYTQVRNVDNKLIAITSSLGYTATYAYNADSERVLQRNSDAYWLHGDHLGSASLTTCITGAVVSEMRYYPFGETRWYTGTAPTNRLYTGQRSLMGVGLYDYNARMYSPSLGRFISADTIVPELTQPQSLNRFSYVNNNPLRYMDATGHSLCDNASDCNENGFTEVEQKINDRSVRYVVTSYGVIDIDHFIGGQAQAQQILGPLSKGYKDITVQQELRFNIGFRATYGVNDSISPDEYEGVALGIFMEYSDQFESWQGKAFIVGAIDQFITHSSYSAEDLPTDYLGFYSTSRDVSLLQIVSMLGGGYVTDEKPNTSYKTNHAFTPIDQETGGNKPWPASLQITPITRSQNTWHKVSQCGAIINGSCLPL